MKPASIITAGAVIGVILVTAGGLYLWKNRAQPAGTGGPGGAPMEHPTAVEVVEVKSVPWQPTADLTGTVIALRSVTISNEIAGAVKTIPFQSGAIVEKDQILLTLDDATERADLAAAESAVRVATANVGVADARLKLAQSEVDRYAGVSAGAISAADVDRAAAELGKAKADRDKWLADVDVAKAGLTQVKTRLEKKTIKAPFRARVGLRNIHEGQYLPQGAEVVRLEEVGDKIYLDFAIPQEYIARVGPGTVVMATSPVMGDKPFRIEVVALDAVVSYDTRNVRVRSIVDNPGDRFRPGMSVSIRVPVDLPANVITIPTTAIRRASYADSVFVIVPDDKPGPMGPAFRARQRFIKTGPALGENTIITEGLKPGEKIAAAGSFKLHENALVILGPPPDAPAGKGPGGPPDSSSKH